MKHLHHNGVLVPPQIEGKGLTIKVNEEKIRLTREQEEMALAWAQKMGTPYVKDHIFAKNFQRDFSKKLGIKVKLDDIDFSNVVSFVQKERERKANLSKEERRQLKAQRKALSEANKERYGYAQVDEARVEVANYAVEPSCIFMGRGKHPLRGRWKEGPREEDIELNLSPDAPRPPGNWKALLWQPDAMWIARWQDKLTGKTKYVWFSESSVLKQRKDIEKFDKAKELRNNLARIQRHIWENLDAEDQRRRKAATVCFLIDKLKIRVGDEKDPDEADTVGASTLRREHIHFNSDGTVNFDFLGKDSVPHIFTVNLPDKVIRNLKEFAANTKSVLFDGVSSKQVNELLDEVITGLSAKVFRTCYASEATETKLKKASIKREDHEYTKKYVATMANLEAAKVCNHRRTIPKTWKSSLEKKNMQLEAMRKRAKDTQDKLRQKAKEQGEKHGERLKKQEIRLKAMEERLEAYRQTLTDKKPQGKTLHALKKHIRLQREAIARQNQSLKELKTKHAEQMKKLKQRLDSRSQRDEAAIAKLALKIKTQKETRDYNLATSLKSYIDPRIYHKWGKEIEYDWKQYYPKTLKKKFSWIETPETPPENS
jgi:DNA topoisomerase-1